MLCAFYLLLLSFDVVPVYMIICMTFFCVHEMFICDQEVIHRHIVQRISFIARDVSDARAFGYVYGCRDGRHQFYGIKTEKVVCCRPL